MIRQTGPNDKPGDATKGGIGLQNLTSHKHLEINFFHVLIILYHQYSITNNSEKFLKSKIMSILIIIFVVVFFYLIFKKNILNCNCSLYIFNLVDNVFNWCNIMQQCIITIHPCEKCTCLMAM